MDSFEFWCPQRRPEGHNIALRAEPGLNRFDVEQLKEGIYRPTTKVNAWVASLEDDYPELKISWDQVQEIRQIDLLFDTDYDHPMESVLMGHPEEVMPFCVRNYQICDDKGQVIYAKEGNYQTINSIELSAICSTKSLTIRFARHSARVPVALFAVRCYKGGQQ